MSRNIKLWLLGTLVGAVAVGGVVISGAVGGPIATRPAVDSKTLAADFLGVPNSAVMPGARDTVVIPPALAPPKGLAYRNWTVRSDYITAPDTPRPTSAAVDLQSIGVRGIWSPPTGSAMRSTPISERTARGLASSFLRSRGKLSGLRIVTCRELGRDASGRISAYAVEFEGSAGPQGPGASLTVDALRGFVSYASYHSKLSPDPTRQPVMTLEVARAMVLAELAKRGITQYKVTVAYLWTKFPGFEVGRPMYAIGIVETRKLAGGGMTEDPQIWLVDGWDRRVAPADDFPESKQFGKALREWHAAKLHPTAQPTTPPK